MTTIIIKENIESINDLPKMKFRNNPTYNKEYIII